MKKLLILLTIPGLLMLSACGDEESSDKEGDGSESTSTEADYSKMQDVPMAEYGLPVTVKVPKIDIGGGNILPHEIRGEEDGFVWEILIGEEGEKYDLMIEIAEGLGDDLIEQHKNSFQDFQKVEYLLEEDDLLMYKITIPEADAELEQYHVFGVATIDGMKYKIYSNPTQTSFRKRHAEMMLNSIRSVQEGVGEEKPAA